VPVDRGDDPAGDGTEAGEGGDAVEDRTEVWIEDWVEVCGGAVDEIGNALGRAASTQAPVSTAATSTAIPTASAPRRPGSRRTRRRAAAGAGASPPDDPGVGDAGARP